MVLARSHRHGLPPRPHALEERGLLTTGRRAATPLHTSAMRRLLRDAMPLRRGEWGLALFLYFFFIDRMRRRTMLLLYVAAVTLLSIGIQYAITYNAIGNIVQPISYVFAHGVKETIYILFWVYAGNLYDSEQSRRLFPFFAGSVLVGKILGGAVGAGIAPLIHAENFIGAQAVGFMVCFLALIVYRGLPEGHGSRLAEERSKGIGASLKDSVEGYRAVASDRMLRTFGVGVFFWYFLMQFGNFL